MRNFVLAACLSVLAASPSLAQQSDDWPIVAPAVGTATADAFGRWSPATAM